MSQATIAPGTELAVSGHLMRLDPGLFCAFSAPGAAPPNPATGLPGIRISPAPGKGGLAGDVTLAGFTSDGWLGGADAAALIRVTGGAAQVLVTVYQEKGTAHEAPKLQVLRLSGPTQPAPASPVEVAAHVYGLGDVPGQLGAWIGERGSRRWVEGFAIHPGGIPATDLEYQAVLGQGWMSPWTDGGQFCGSRGMALPILGLRVRLRGGSAETHELQLSATFVDGAAIGPVASGAACEAPSLAALEAFCIAIAPKVTPPRAVRARRQPG